MIRADQLRFTRCDLVAGVVDEYERRPAANHAAIPKNVEIVVERQLTQRDDNTDAREKIEFAFQVLAAASHLVARRLVVRRSTSDGCGNVRITQPQAIID